ncbi:SAM domain-like protein [Ranid herpesvirus 3]|uniref:SAM domain-like protein n=1 Tax=Ranid herpesvirus 3 TaxID=1987509 RepID=A0A1X9T5L0_9VIRU|nr:SAM domain-like protein [Ranid herpesvirus 3]ARR28977.1 SAM domain-like protein [Ranid herpesvirus 3]
MERQRTKHVINPNFISLTHVCVWLRVLKLQIFAKLDRIIIVETFKASYVVRNKGVISIKCFKAPPVTGPMLLMRTAKRHATLLKPSPNKVSSL